MRIIQLLLFLGLIAGIVLLIVSWRTAAQHTAPARFTYDAPPADFPYRLESISFRTRDGLNLRGWYGQAPDERGTVILLHRYRAGREFMLSRARWYAQRGFSVLLYDARATGESAGDRISLGYHETQDLTAALHWVRARSTRPIVCHGVSQGGATILLAADRLGDVAAVIVESTYDTLIHAGDRRFRNSVGLPGWIAGIFYRPFVELHMGLNVRDVQPVDHIGRLPCPVFVLSGADDRHTLEEDTIRLYEAAQDPKELWIVPGAAHVDLHTIAPGEYERRLGEFIDAWVPASPTSR